MILMAQLKVLKDGLMLSHELGRHDFQGREIPLNESKIYLAGDLVDESSLSVALRARIKNGELDHVLGSEDAKVPDNQRVLEDNARRTSSDNPATQPSPASDDSESDADDDTPAEPVNYADTAAFTPEALEALVTERGLQVTGTGKDGNVLRGDREKALTEADAAAAGDQQA